MNDLNTQKSPSPLLAWALATNMNDLNAQKSPSLLRAWANNAFFGLSQSHGSYHAYQDRAVRVLFNNLFSHAFSVGTPHLKPA
jgi:hypothetical protein